MGMGEDDDEETEGGMCVGAGVRKMKCCNLTDTPPPPPTHTLLTTSSDCFISLRSSFRR